MCVISLAYLRQGGYKIANVYPGVYLFVCLSVREQDHAKSFQATFMKPWRITDYCYGKILRLSRIAEWPNGSYFGFPLHHTG